MAILSQLMQGDDFRELTAQDLRNIILKLDEHIAQAHGEKILISLQANIVGVKNDKPAGADPEVVMKPAGAVEEWQKSHAKARAAKK